MVCLGNICRSPMAEGILQYKANMAGLNWKVDSAGTGNYHIGEAPHRLSQKTAKLHGIDISQQVCRQLVKEDMLLFDKIYAMDISNYNDIKMISGNLWDATKVELILNALFPNQNVDVPDPWYGNENNFREVFNMLSQACDAIIKNVTTDYKEKKFITNK